MTISACPAAATLRMEASPATYAQPPPAALYPTPSLNVDLLLLYTCHCQPPSPARLDIAVTQLDLPSCHRSPTQPGVPRRAVTATGDIAATRATLFRHPN
ncbi:hypothetical protein FJTKL_08382 [Diaporthe vaccinii]|uniref:Uncharacterized protein n=1 Tax=Diaporthe vaccinii TaxID=105482 RepID=A0ABR4ERT8_9PEZI